MSYPSRTAASLLTVLFIPACALAQDKLEDGTTLSWTHEIAVAMDSLRADSLMLPAYTTTVWEARASETEGLLTKAIPTAKFKKSGDLLRAENVIFPPGTALPATLLARTVEDKKAGEAKLYVALLRNGQAVAPEPATEAAVRDLSVRLNKAVVQQQIDSRKKMLDRSANKTASAVKSQDKTQGNLNKAQAELEKIAKKKTELQQEHNLLEKEIALDNERWNTSQEPKDLAKLTKSRGKIAKNESKLADLLKQETKTQGDITKYSAALPDAAKAHEAKAASQAEVQRAVDSLQHKLDSIK